MMHIVTALSSRTIGAFPSSIESYVSTPGTKSIETCKVISLRSGKEYKELSQQVQDKNKQGENKKSSMRLRRENPKAEKEHPLVEKESKEGMQSM